MAKLIPVIGDKVYYKTMSLPWKPDEVTMPRPLYEVTKLLIADRYPDDNPLGGLAFQIRNTGDSSDVHICTLDQVEVRDAEVTEPFFDDALESPHINELGYDMLKWMEGREPRPDNETLYPVISALTALQYDKEGSYGSSWKGKGEYRGIMANIDRKYDRLDNLTNLEISGSKKTLSELESDCDPSNLVQGHSIPIETKIDAVADLANYLLLYMGYLREQYPRLFELWMEYNVLSHYSMEDFPLMYKDTETTEDR